ncbi:glycoside hydrolase family protein [Aureliella helgolandensis]|uniref:Glycosyl hydrolases family 43 n=1 Tax=Aureliella helgolandensis TaxID=2527968 RepID=A0A518G2W6_9BACT|nr:hypothetical protein [Aureliella helgolandensis]QDV22934.1 hypothetical protein Q31a_12270 [Aureliella helgolandensis]
MPRFPYALLLTILLTPSAFADETLVPTIQGPWIRIAGNPDLGEFTGPKQQPVDFGVWQAADGTWQAWSCIRRTKCGGHTRLFHRWEGESLTQPNWKPMGIAMESDPSVGEVAGGLQAPHVVREGGQFHMFYGDWNNICHAISEDGKVFQRVIQPSGMTAMFTEGAGNNTRDVAMLKVGDLWHAYYTAYPNDQGAVYVRTTEDFKTWSNSTTVSFGGFTTTGKFSAECPHVVQRNGRFYLFRTQHYGTNGITTVYHSKDPKMFGINQDERYLATRLAVAAPEIVHHDGEDFIVALTPELDGIQLARLKWLPKPKLGPPLWSFDEASVRAGWKIESGNLPGPFTNSKRSDFNALHDYFIGTSELQQGFDDSRTGQIRSPEFEVTEASYYATTSGGADKTLYLALIDSETQSELLRVKNATNSNSLRPQLIHTDQWIGRRVFLRIVDQSTDGWGHFNFGGLYTAER